MKEIMDKLEELEKKIDIIDSNVGILIGRQEYHFPDKPIDSTSDSRDYCFVCNRPKEDCICFKSVA